jgi:Flp pilus assembly protein CpaB
MNISNRLWHVVVAVGLGVVALAMTAFYVSNYKRHVQHGEAQVTVLVAAKDIPVDTPGAQVISQHLLQPERVARRQIVPGAISSSDQVRNLIVTQPIYAGEQVTTRRLGTHAQLGVRAQINGTLRAYQLPGDANQLLAGTLAAGDHVDVVAAWQWPDNGKKVSRDVIRNLLVLAPPNAPAHAGGIGSPTNQTFSLQLALTDAQSQKLQWLVANAQWHLELRPSTGSADSPGSVTTSGTLLADGVKPVTLFQQLTTPTP